MGEKGGISGYRFCKIISLYSGTESLPELYPGSPKNGGIPGVLPDRAEPDFKSLIIEEEAIRALYAAIDRLPAQTSRVIRMSLKGLKNQAIAEELGISVNSVKTLKYNALHTLRKELQGSAWLLLFWLELHL